MALRKKAIELGEQIRNTPEYRELKRAGESLKQDASAQQLIQGVQEAHRQIEFQQRAGVQPSAEQVLKLNDLQEQMQINITVQGFIKAQENFNNLMKEVNAGISEGINGGPLPENPEQD